MYSNSKSTDKFALLLDSIAKLFPPEVMKNASYFEITWSHDNSNEISAPGCVIGFNKIQDYITTLPLDPSTEPSSEMYNEVRALAQKYNIKIVVPSTSDYQI